MRGAIPGAPRGALPGFSREKRSILSGVQPTELNRRWAKQRVLFSVCSGERAIYF